MTLYAATRRGWSSRQAGLYRRCCLCWKYVDLSGFMTQSESRDKTPEKPHVLDTQRRLTKERWHHPSHLYVSAGLFYYVSYLDTLSNWYVNVLSERITCLEKAWHLRKQQLFYLTRQMCKSFRQTREAWIWVEKSPSVGSRGHALRISVLRFRVYPQSYVPALSDCQENQATISDHAQLSVWWNSWPLLHGRTQRVYCHWQLVLLAFLLQLIQHYKEASATASDRRKKLEVLEANQRWWKEGFPAHRKLV